MIDNYTSISVLTLVTLMVLCILVGQNPRIERRDKALFYNAYILIALALFAEWAGVKISNADGFPNWLLKVVKCIDYTFTPVAGASLVGPMKSKSLSRKILYSILIINTIFQVISSFFGLVFVVENGKYSHGPFYNIYIVLYLLTMIFIIVEFVHYGSTFTKHNKGSLYSIMLLAFLGICMQEFLGVDTRTAYLALAISAALLYIHYTEFSQQSTDEHMRMQKAQISTDALTGIRNRYSYNNAMQKLEKKEKLPEDIVIYVIDINGLKIVNDTLGHEAGDELICGAALCIESAILDTDGKCYRIGGDEFVIIAHQDRHEIEIILKSLQEEADKWSGNRVKHLSMSTGYAAAVDYENATITKLAEDADKHMYEAKSEYYKNHPDARRRSTQTH